MFVCIDLGMLRDFDNKEQDPIFSQIYELDLCSVVPSLSGPKRPQGKLSKNMKSTIDNNHFFPLL